MKRFDFDLVILILLFCLILFLMLAALSGCIGNLSPQPQLHPTAGKSVMFIPNGCEIGDVIVEENGIFIGESILIEQMRKERESEQRKRRQRI